MASAVVRIYVSCCFYLPPSVTAIKILANGDILIGTGEGKLARISIQNMQLIR